MGEERPGRRRARSGAFDLGATPEVELTSGRESRRGRGDVPPDKAIRLSGRVRLPDDLPYPAPESLAPHAPRTPPTGRPRAPLPSAESAGHADNLRHSPRRHRGAALRR